MSTMVELLILGVIAALILYKLWSMLGETNEADQEMLNERKKKAAIATTTAKIEDILKPANTVDGGIQRVMQLDPKFNQDVFTDTSQKVHGLVFKAFTEGDKELLKTLLSNEIFTAYNKVVDDYKEKDWGAVIELRQYLMSCIEKVSLEGDVATITVKFVTMQINYVKNLTTGDVVEGNNDLEEIRDVWDFTRDLKSDSPIWQVTAIR